MCLWKVPYVIICIHDSKCNQINKIYYFPQTDRPMKSDYTIKIFTRCIIFLPIFCIDNRSLQFNKTHNVRWYTKNTQNINKTPFTSALPCTLSWEYHAMELSILLLVIKLHCSISYNVPWYGSGHKFCCFVNKNINKSFKSLFKQKNK